MAIREVVLSRDEFVRHISSKLPDKTDIGRMVKHVENAFVFQNDVGRPAYLLEVDYDIDDKTISYLSECLNQMTVCACLIPKDVVSYVGTVTPESMGVENLKTTLFNRQPVDWDDFPEEESE